LVPPNSDSRYVFLVACVAHKANAPRPARNLYISPWFRMAATLAERNSNAWFILSAKHGLLPPDKVIPPYNKTLSLMTRQERRTWAEQVLQNLGIVLKNADVVVFLAGLMYRYDLVRTLRERGHTVQVPMEGLRIGEQLAWLKRNLAGAESWPWNAWL